MEKITKPADGGPLRSAEDVVSEILVRVKESNESPTLITERLWPNAAASLSPEDLSDLAKQAIITRVHFLLSRERNERPTEENDAEEPTRRRSGRYRPPHAWDSEESILARIRYATANGGNAALIDFTLEDFRALAANARAKIQGRDLGRLSEGGAVELERVKHREDCVGGDKCAPIGGGDWDQPQGSYLNEAMADLADDETTPYCVIHARAWELQGADEDEEEE